MKIPFFTQWENSPAVPPPESISRLQPPLEGVMHYHEETKHQAHRYARSMGYLDWDTQPNPFRRFEGAPVVRLPLLPIREVPLYGECFDPGAVVPEAVSVESISRLFRNSLAISAWKRYQETRWALRVNPSSGNLHPTEGYAILGGISDELCAGVYHYASDEHALERRAILTHSTFETLMNGFPAGSFLVGLTSLPWREAWKYGERAYRYCQHDTGHALAALRIAAAALGWQLVVLEELSDPDVAALLGLNRTADYHEAEDEDPDLIAVVIPSQEPLSPETSLHSDTIKLVEAGDWQGHANRLSSNHVEWNIIEEVALNSLKERTAVKMKSMPVSMPSLETHRVLSAEKIVQQRRSAVAFDGLTSITAQQFFHLLSRVSPAMTVIPFDALVRSELGMPRVHLAIFVHLVEGLDQGLYVLVRDPAKLPELKAAMHPRFVWIRPSGCPPELELYGLEKADLRRISAGVSCGQAIASDGAFSLGMIAEFETPIWTIGPWLYRRLFWETGIIGQVLYLEAEAAGIRATGIGCFFDDPMHEILGLKGRKFQSLYHFTMGGPVEDTRLTTEPPL
jgi:SagB-type dehydrogenase family enzyme